MEETTTLVMKRKMSRKNTASSRRIGIESMKALVGDPVVVVVVVVPAIVSVAAVAVVYDDVVVRSTLGPSEH